MPINIGKNLKIEPTNDNKVSKFVRSYNQIYNYINNIVLTTKKYAYVIKDIQNTIYYTESKIEELSAGDTVKFWDFTIQTGLPYKINSNKWNSSQDTLTVVNVTSDTITADDDGVYVRCEKFDIYTGMPNESQEPLLYYYDVEHTEEHGDVASIACPWKLTSANFPTESWVAFDGDIEDYENIKDIYAGSGGWNAKFTGTPSGEVINGTAQYGDCTMTLNLDKSIYKWESVASNDENLMLYDLLMAIMPMYSITFTNIPSGATFTWYVNGTEVQGLESNVLKDSTINYELVYTDGSKHVDEFVVSEDFSLDLSTLEPNKFLVTITADKTITKLVIIHNYVDYDTPREHIPINQTNVYTFECDKNEKFVVLPTVNGYTENENRSIYSVVWHYYTVTQNISETYSFPYVSWSRCRIAVKDENGDYIDLTNEWLNYITYSGDSSKYTDMGIAEYSSTKQFWIEKDKTSSVSYTISVPNYSTITDTFGSSNSEDILQTKTLVPYVTYTITPSPSDATVTLTAPGYTTVSGTDVQSIIVAAGTAVTYVVSKVGCATRTKTETISSNTSKTILLVSDPIFESATPGTYNVTIPVDGVYDIKLVGGGAGGVTFIAYFSDQWWSNGASGGSGSYVYGQKYLTAGTYTVVVGSGAAGVASQTVAQGNSGTASSAFGEVANGGSGGSSGAAGGAGGTAAPISLNGVNGYSGTAIGTVLGQCSLPRVATPLDGTTTGYGSGGGVAGDMDGRNGYVKISWYSEA